MTSLRHARSIAVTEVRRSLRASRDSRRGLLLLLAVGAVVPLYGLGIGAGAYVLGEAVVEGAGLPTTVFRSALAGVAVFVALMAGQRAIKKTGEPPAADGLLTTTDYGTVLAGVLGAEYVRVVGTMAVVGLGAAVGFALGTGSALAGAVLLALFALLGAVGVLAGYLGGLLVRYVLGRSATVARHRGAIGLFGSFGILAVYVLATSLPAVQRVLLRVAAKSPFAWFADLVLLAVPAAPASPLRAVGGVASLLVALPALAVATDRAARRVWYMDPVEVDHAFDPDETTLSDRLLTGTVPAPVRVVAQKSWRRARRAPFTVQFAAFPAFFLLLELQTIARTGAVPDRLPLLAGLAVATAAGAAFTLNPLGGEDDVLPAVLTARVSGRQFVAGLALAGALPGAALAAVAVAGLGAVAGLDPTPLALALATSLTVTLAAPPIASGWGVVFPKFEASEVRDREVVVPSGWAFGCYGLALLVVLAPALSTQVPALRSIVGDALAVGPLSPGVAGFVLTTGLAALFGVPSFLYAAGRVGEYRFD